MVARKLRAGIPYIHIEGSFSVATYFQENKIIVFADGDGNMYQRDTNNRIQRDKKRKKWGPVLQPGHPVNRGCQIAGTGNAAHRQITIESIGNYAKRSEAKKENRFGLTHKFSNGRILHANARSRPELLIIAETNKRL